MELPSALLILKALWLKDVVFSLEANVSVCSFSLCFFPKTATKGTFQPTPASCIDAHLTIESSKITL